MWSGFQEPGHGPVSEDLMWRCIMDSNVTTVMLKLKQNGGGLRCRSEKIITRHGVPLATPSRESRVLGVVSNLPKALRFPFTFFYFHFPFSVYHICFLFPIYRVLSDARVEFLSLASGCCLSGASPSCEKKKDVLEWSFSLLRVSIEKKRCARVEFLPLASV